MRIYTNSLHISMSSFSFFVFSRGFSHGSSLVYFTPVLFFSAHPRCAYFLGHIHHDICVIASSTHPIPSEGGTNAGRRSSSGLCLTFLRYVTLFLLIMRAARHVSSFIYHSRFSQYFHPRSFPPAFTRSIFSVSQFLTFSE